VILNTRKKKPVCDRMCEIKENLSISQLTGSGEVSGGGKRHWQSSGCCSVPNVCFREKKQKHFQITNEEQKRRKIYIKDQRTSQRLGAAYKTKS
jgi:hypothetical protein